MFFFLYLLSLTLFLKLLLRDLTLNNVFPGVIFTSDLNPIDVIRLMLIRFAGSLVCIVIVSINDKDFFFKLLRIQILIFGNYFVKIPIICSTRFICFVYNLYKWKDVETTYIHLEIAQFSDSSFRTV